MNNVKNNQRRKEEKKGGLQKQAQESEALAAPSCSTFSQVTKKEEVAHTGEVWVAGLRQRAQGKGACSVFFVLVLPFLLNKMMCGQAPLSVVTLHEKHGKLKTKR